MPACRSEETQEKLAQCLTSLRCRLRVRCHCAECVAVSKSRDHRTPRGGSKHLAAMVLKETEDTNQTAANPTNQKVSCVATLPIPAGGFCRRSAAVQLMLAQEMCRQTALDDEPFDCADHDWPTLFEMDDLDTDDFGFDFEIIDVDEDDDFVLHMLTDDEIDESLDGEWAEVWRANPSAAAAAADALAAAASGKDFSGKTRGQHLDFKGAIRKVAASMPPAPTSLKAVRAPTSPATVSAAATPSVKTAIAMAEASAVRALDYKKITRSATDSKAAGPARQDQWPTLTGTSTETLSSSPSSVCEVAGQWVAAVERQTEAEDESIAIATALFSGADHQAKGKKSRNFREVCRRTAAQLRRAEKRALAAAAAACNETSAHRKQLPPDAAEEFPPLCASFA